MPSQSSNCSLHLRSSYSKKLSTSAIASMRTIHPFVLILVCLMHEAFNWRLVPHSCLRKSKLVSPTALNVVSSTPSAVAPSSTTGQVFVCTNQYCRDKGSDATMATFTFLTPQVSSGDQRLQPNRFALSRSPCRRCKLLASIALGGVTKARTCGF